MHISHRAIADLTAARRIEFSHIDADADRGTWRADIPICLDHLKINIFIGGDYSLFIGDKGYTPHYGDVCVLPHGAIHYGRISRPTHTDYYQLDIGGDAFFGVPYGKELLLTAANSTRGGIFFRPTPEIAKRIIQSAEEIEATLDNPTLAFAKTVELLSLISSLTSFTAPPSIKSKHIASVIRRIEQDFSLPLKLEELARECGISTSYLSREFKHVIGTTVHEYLNNYRIQRSLKLLSDMSVAEVAALVGFSDSSHYIGIFKRVIGTTPAAYKAKLTANCKYSL